MHHGYRVFLEDGSCSLLPRENAARRSVDFVSRLDRLVGWRRSRWERIGRSLIAIRTVTRRRSRRERIGRSVIVRLPWSIVHRKISSKIIRVFFLSPVLLLVLSKARLVLHNGALQVRLGDHHILRLDRANQLHFSQFLVDATDASLLVSPFSYDVQ